MATDLERAKLGFADGTPSHLDPGARVPDYVPPDQRRAFERLTHYPYSTDFFQQDVGGPEHRNQTYAEPYIRNLRWKNRVATRQNEESRFANTQGKPDAGRAAFSIAEFNGHTAGTLGPTGAVLPFAQRPNIGGGGILNDTVEIVDAHRPRRLR